MLALCRRLQWFLRSTPALRALVLLAITMPLTWLAEAAAAPKAYVGLFKDNAIAVLDTGTNRVQATIPVPQGPHGIVITPDGRKVYVSSDGASTVSVIDTQTDTIVKSIEVDPNPHGLAISADGREVLVSAFGTNQVLLIDTSTDQIVRRLPVPMPHNSALSPDGHMAYVGSQQQGATAVVILDLVQGTQVGTVPLEKTPRGLTLSPDAKQLYVTVAGTDAVQVIDLASQRVVGQIPVGASPHIVMMLPNGNAGLVVSQGPGTLEFFDPTRHTVSRTVRVGTNPHWLAVSSEGRAAYVSNEGSQDISVVDVASGTVTATVQVGNAPRKIVVQPGPVSQGTTPALLPPSTLEESSLLDLIGVHTIFVQILSLTYYTHNCLWDSPSLFCV